MYSKEIESLEKKSSLNNSNETENDNEESLESRIELFHQEVLNNIKNLDEYIDSIDLDSDPIYLNIMNSLDFLDEYLRFLNIERKKSLDVFDLKNEFLFRNIINHFHNRLSNLKGSRDVDIRYFGSSKIDNRPWLLQHRLTSLYQRSLGFQRHPRRVSFSKDCFELSQGIFAKREGGTFLLSRKNGGDEFFSKINIEDVFVSNDTEDLESQLEDFVAIRSRYSKIMWCDMSNLSIPEQFSVFNFLKGKKVKDITNLEIFAKKYGITGFRTFLSLQHNRELGDEIVGLGNTLPEEDARAIFEKYSEIVDVANNVESYILQKVSGIEDVTQEEINSIRNNVLRRGTDLLSEFSKKVKVASEKGEEVDSEEITRQLETFKNESILFASTFRGLRDSLAQRGRADGIFELMNGVSFETSKGVDLPKKDVDQMSLIFDQNYSDDPKLRKIVKSSFTGRLENPEVDFYLLKDDEKVISFLSLQPQKEERTFHKKFGVEMGEGETYFGSFNSFNGYKGGTVGEAMMRRVLDKEAETKIIHADCSAFSGIASKYVEDGFVATKKFNQDEINGLEIVRDDSREFQSKKLSQEEIVKISLQKNLGLPHDHRELIIKVADRQKDLDFSLIENEDGGYVLTRYFKFPNDAKWYVVFEKYFDKL